MKVRVVAGAATLFTSAALFLSQGRVAGYADGAPSGFSGGLGEQTCHACHFHFDLNSGRGRLTIAGLPERVVAGDRYPFTVTLTRPGTKLAGFQLTARFKDGGAQAGTVSPAPGEQERIGVDQGGIQYVNQRRAGAALAAADPATWSLVWTAPAMSGPVVFHVAANAANGDETADGDYVHTTAVEAWAGGSGPQSR